MVQMMAVHLDRPECDAGYSGTLLSKDEESEPKELRMPQNITESSRPADLDSMGKSNESIRLLDWRNCEQFFLIRVDWFDSSIRTVFMCCSTYCCNT